MGWHIIKRLLQAVAVDASVNAAIGNQVPVISTG
jgi:hypothetical protein